MRLPPAINWLRTSIAPGDLLITFEDPASRTKLFDTRGSRGMSQATQYSQIMPMTSFKEFLHSLLDTWLNSLELMTVPIIVETPEDAESQMQETFEDQERLVGTRLLRTSINFKGLDPRSKDDDESIMFGRLKPDTNIEEVRSSIEETIDYYTSMPLRVSEITLYISEKVDGPLSTKITVRPIHSVDLNEFFNLS